MTAETTFIFKQLRRKKNNKHEKCEWQACPLSHCGAGVASRMRTARLSCVFPQARHLFSSVTVTCLSLPVGSIHDTGFGSAEERHAQCCPVDLMAQAGSQAIEKGQAGQSGTWRAMRNTQGSWTQSVRMGRRSSKGAAKTDLERGCCQGKDGAPCRKGDEKGHGVPSDGS